MNSPSYAAYIPASVRYHQNLTPGAKLLYGELTALCDREGYCWATNKYFSDLYEVKGPTISLWVSSLKTAGFITVTVDPSKGNERRIFLTDARNIPGGSFEKSKEGLSINEGRSFEKSKSTILENDTIKRSSETSSLVLDSEPPERKKRRGTINGEKPSQEMIEKFAVGLGLPKSDGTAMYWHFVEKNWQGVKNWEATVRKWREFGYLPSQKHSKFNGRSITPLADDPQPPGWPEWLAGHKEYQPFCRGLPYRACREYIRLEFERETKKSKV